MTLDELIYQRFSSVKYFEENLARYVGSPAVFYQIAPDDRQKSWKGEQYPRIVYTIDMQADEERKVLASCRWICTVMKQRLAGGHRTSYQRMLEEPHCEARRKFAFCFCMG